MSTPTSTATESGAPADAPTGVLLTSALLSFSLLGTWGALYAMTPEVYPTNLRATGMGTAGAVARLGGLAAPSVLAVLAARDFTAMIGLFAALVFSVARLASILPQYDDKFDDLVTSFQNFLTSHGVSHDKVQDMISHV